MRNQGMLQTVASYRENTITVGPFYMHFILYWKFYLFIPNDHPIILVAYSPSRLFCEDVSKRSYCYSILVIKVSMKGTLVVSSRSLEKYLRRFHNCIFGLAFMVSHIVALMWTSGQKQ